VATYGFDAVLDDCNFDIEVFKVFVRGCCLLCIVPLLHGHCSPPSSVHLIVLLRIGSLVVLFLILYHLELLHHLLLLHGQGLLLLHALLLLGLLLLLLLVKLLLLGLVLVGCVASRRCLALVFISHLTLLL